MSKIASKKIDKFLDYLEYIQLHVKPAKAGVNFSYDVRHSVAKDFRVSMEEFYELVYEWQIVSGNRNIYISDCMDENDIHDENFELENRIVYWVKTKQRLEVVIKDIQEYLAKADNQSINTLIVYYNQDKGISLSSDFQQKETYGIRGQRKKLFEYLIDGKKLTASDIQRKFRVNGKKAVKAINDKFFKISNKKIKLIDPGTNGYYIDSNRIEVCTQ